MKTEEEQLENSGEFGMDINSEFFYEEMGKNFSFVKEEVGEFPLKKDLC